MLEYVIKKIYSFFYSEKKNFVHFMIPLFVIYGIWFSWINLVFYQYYFRSGINHWQFELFQCSSLLFVLFSMPFLIFTNIDKLNLKLFLWKMFLVCLAFRFADISISFLTSECVNFEEKTTQQFILICNFFIFLVVQKIACKYIIRQLSFDCKKENSE
ncbi:hypothetical protein D352_00027 [Enterococcus faecium LA4B-2]|nr:hypothetical protein D352_00027 [Enterococcus faecium LA4B-2]